MVGQISIDRAELAIPHLVEAAKNRELLTYGKIGGLVGCHPIVVRFFLCYIRDEICKPNKLPMLTVIVVSAATGIPGESFIEEGTAHLSPQQYKQRFQREKKKVFSFPHWDLALNKLGYATKP